MKRLLFVFLSDHWVKLHTYPVCFGARGEQYGTFYAPSGGGKLAAIKLVHLYGYVSCGASSSSSWSYWGCNVPVVRYAVGVVITTSRNSVILPPSKFLKSDSGLRHRKWSNIPGYTGMSPSLVLSFDSHPYRLYSRQALRLWYGEDLQDSTENNNGGRVCCYVYGRFV